MPSKSMLDPIIRALVGVDPVHHGVILDVVHKLGGQNAESVRTRLTQALREPLALKQGSTCLTYLTSATIFPTKGGVSIAAAKEVFTGHIDSGFQDLGTDIVGNDTLAQVVDVLEISQDSTFAQYFNTLGDPYSLCLTQGQIVEFCRTHRNQFQQCRYYTFFLFQVKGELFVIGIRERAGKLSVDLNPFDYDHVWFARLCHRVVVKQQIA